MRRTLTEPMIPGRDRLPVQPILFRTERRAATLFTASLCGLGLSMLLCGCGPSGEIEVRHNVAKEVERPLPGGPNSTAAGQMPGMPSRENIPIAYITPQGWKEEPASGFRNASFLISGDDGATSDVSISNLPTAGSSLMDNVNRWRAQVKLPPLTATSELEQNCRQETIDGKRCIWVEIIGPAPAPTSAPAASSSSPAPASAPPAASPATAPVAPMMQPKSGNPARFAQKIVAALFVAEPRVWFIKMSGDEPLVTAQQANFRLLVTSFKFANAPGETPVAPGSGTLSGQPASPSSATAPAPGPGAGGTAADPHAAATPEQMEKMRARMKSTGELAERSTNSPSSSPNTGSTPLAPLTNAPASAPAATAAPAPGAMSGTVPTGAAVQKPAWKLPEGWVEKEAKPPRIATIGITTAAGAADVSVTSFPGDVGGKLANINRWRGQISLAPLTSDDDLTKQSEAFRTAPGGKEATLVYFVGEKPEAGAILAVIVFDGTQSWFFKATGPDAVLSTQKQQMIDLVQSSGF